MRTGPAQPLPPRDSRPMQLHSHTQNLAHARAFKQALGSDGDCVILGGQTLIVLTLTESARLSAT